MGQRYKYIETVVPELTFFFKNIFKIAIKSTTTHSIKS
jgi:hypothetical protein